MTASQPGGRATSDLTSNLGDQLELLATIDEFLRSPTIGDQLAAFLTARDTTGPTGNGMFAACTLIDLFSFTIADLRHRLRTGSGPAPARTDTSAPPPRPQVTRAPGS